jgi:hypothetical protein
VTGQAVGESGYFFFRLIHMAIKTPAHIHLYKLPGYIHLTDIPMTGLTIKTRAKMRLVTEINKIRLYVYPYPGDWLPIFIIVGDLLYLWAIRLDHIVASHTFLNRRDASYQGLKCTGMAIKTLDSRFNMHLVAVSNGLLRGSVNLDTGEDYPCDYTNYN